MRFIFNPATKNLETTDNVTGPDVTLGDKFKFAELDNFNTPDLGQQDSRCPELQPGEGHPSKKTWDVSLLEDRMLMVGKHELQIQFAPQNVERVAAPRYVIRPENTNIKFKPDPKKVKLYKKATWDKIYQYKTECLLKSCITEGLKKAKILGKRKISANHYE